jgi:hypothetical protein
MRKTKTVTITEEGRDKGKNYHLTEMPVWDAEKWAARAILALAKSGVEIPDGVEGMAGLAALGLGAIMQIRWEDAEPLLDDMLKCIKFMPSAGVIRPLILEQDDIEEIDTLLTLRKEILGLHFDFFLDAVDSISDTKARAE